MAESILEGAKALEATLKGVRDSVRKRIMRKAVEKSMVVVAGEIRKSVPPITTPGHSNKRIKKSVGYRRLKARHDIESGKAGLRVGNSEKAKAAPHAHWIPLGTQERVTKDGKKRGRVQPLSLIHI